MAAASRFFFTLTLTLSVFLLPLVYCNSEGDALYTFRRSLSDPDNLLQSWDPTLVNPCTWFHITCNQDNRVTRVDLGNSNLSGHLVPELGKLEHLQYLFVSHPCSFPWIICSLFVKRTVVFDLVAILGLFWLRGWGVWKSVPLFLHKYDSLLPINTFILYGHPCTLKYRELYKNNIQGTIPAELGNLKSLISLDLYNNNISGTIPPSLGKLKSLVFLRLNDNRLTGPIPRDLTGISSLKVVDVSNNDLCGTIPTSGPFEHIPLNNFENNHRLEGPELLGLASYDTNCS